MFRFVVLLLAVSSFAFGRQINIRPLSNDDQNLDGRIVGGINTTIEEHPYQVTVELFKGHWCGGSLISPNAVLTAAHCVVNWAPKDYRIRAGATIKETGGQIANVVQICSHPKFTYLLDYDVSVLLLDRSVKLGVGVHPIELQPAGVEVATGTLATATGWGALASGGAGPEILQEVQVAKVDDGVCRSSYSAVGDDVTSRMTCYGFDEGGRDACQGDSGGPLVANGRQVGIVSWGERCARKGFPGIYARVENEDIQNHINQCLM